MHASMFCTREISRFAVKISRRGDVRARLINRARRSNERVTEVTVRFFSLYLIDHRTDWIAVRSTQLF